MYKNSNAVNFLVFTFLNAGRKHGGRQFWVWMDRDQYEPIFLIDMTMNSESRAARTFSYHLKVIKYPGNV